VISNDVFTERPGVTTQCKEEIDLSLVRASAAHDDLRHDILGDSGAAGRGV
jgi:hypothetical protein